ncbi:MAG TPA: glycosyltransferase 87 family protein [Actinomycetota bacterium]|nr:glycosyltransferase 87 family protein [Actinomycetota bacterium]
MGSGRSARAAVARGFGWFTVLVVALLGLAAFFLARPLLDAAPPYRPRPEGSPFAYWYLEAAAFVPYWLALAWPRTARLPATGVVLGGAAVLYLLLIPAPAQQSQDVYQYLVYGKMAAAGINPYTTAPAVTGDPWLAFGLWDDAPTVYGPLWTLLSAGAVRVAEGSLLGAFLTVKSVTAALAVATAALLARSTSGTEGRAANVAAFAFAYNPLVVLSVGLGAHADVAVAAAVAGAVLAERRRRDVVATVLVTAAALIKVYAAVALIAWLIALAWRRGAGRAMGHAAVAAAALITAYAPFWAGAATLSGISRVRGLASASLAGTIIRAITGLPNDAAAGASTAGSVVRVLGSVVLAAAVLMVARSPTTAPHPWRAAALLFGVYVLVTPWYLPWHLLGGLALAAAVSDDRVSWALWVFAGTSLIVASGATLLPAGLAVIGLTVQTALRYGPPVAAYAAWPKRPSECKVPQLP